MNNEKKHIKNLVIIGIVMILILVGLVAAYCHFIRIPLNGPSKDSRKMMDLYDKTAIEKRGIDEGAVFLPEKERRIYNYLVPQIKEVAEGKRTDSSFRIPVQLILGEPKGETGSKLIYTKESLSIENIDGKNISKAILNFNDKSIITALWLSSPYEMFWAGRTWNLSTDGIKYNSKDDKIVIYKSDAYITLNFKVSKDYSINGKSDGTETDPKKIEKANKIIKNADKIVEEAKDKNDYQKLKYYMEKICELASYNKECPSEDYGNPWQLLWVFDENPDTKVVCEGYSKAFKYLCDKTDFDEPVQCHIVTGYVSKDRTKSKKSRHMWNVVKFSNGENYLVDCTGADMENGVFDVLFLAGAPEVNGWYYIVGSQREVDKGVVTNIFFNYYYCYDKETEELYKGQNLINIAEKSYGR